jgi:methyl-accepting chemotaxis protein
MSLLARLKIGPKLLLAPVAVVLLMLMASCASYLAMLGQNQAFTVIVDERAGRIRAVGELLAQAQQAHANVYQLLTWMGASISEARVDALAREIRRRRAAIGRRFDALARDSAGRPREQHLLQLAASAYRGYQHDIADFLEIARQDQSISANAMSKAERSFDLVEHHLGALAALERSLSEQAREEARRQFGVAAVLLPGLVLLSVVTTIGITFAVRNTLLRQLGAISAAASGLAQGDLSVTPRTEGGDEIAETARALDAGIRCLNRSLREVRSETRELARELTRVELGRVDLGRADPGRVNLSRADRRRVRDAAAEASTLQLQALTLQRAVARFRLDGLEERAPPPLTLAGGSHLRLVWPCELTRSR